MDALWYNVAISFHHSIDFKLLFGVTPGIHEIQLHAF